MVPISTDLSIPKQLPGMKVELDGDKFAIYFSYLELGNPAQIANFLHKLNTAVFADLIIQALHNYGHLTKTEEKTKQIVTEFINRWKATSPAIDPTKVFTRGG